jgi:hypothetical protein
MAIVRSPTIGTGAETVFRLEAVTEASVKAVTPSVSVRVIVIVLGPVAPNFTPYPRNLAATQGIVKGGIDASVASAVKVDFII